MGRVQCSRRLGAPGRECNSCFNIYVLRLEVWSENHRRQELVRIETTVGFLQRFTSVNQDSGQVADLVGSGLIMFLNFPSSGHTWVRRLLRTWSTWKTRDRQGVKEWNGCSTELARPQCKDDFCFVNYFVRQLRHKGDTGETMHLSRNAAGCSFSLQRWLSLQGPPPFETPTRHLA